MMKAVILVVEDESSIRFSLRRFFTSQGFEVHEAESVAQGMESFRSSRPDVVLLDYCLPDGDGIGLLRAFRGIDPLVPVVILTAHGTINLAVEAIKEGAEQFFTKPVELPALLLVIERVIDNQRNRQVRLAGKSREARQTVDPFLSQNPAIRKLAEQARKVAASTSPVLIQGETGTGKGLLASWLHQNGPRSEEAFVDLNCAGLSREFLETELFGHERGAFTGAVTAKVGLLEVAHHGTVFLDEIGDVHPEVQPKLLKVLEEHRFRRLGEIRDRHVDIRLIAATRHDLARLVREKRFRDDLYYRINTIPLFVPPLRERGGDVVLLARTLLDRVATDLGRTGMRLSEDAERAIEAHNWPGNLRELHNKLERAALLGDHRELSAEDLFEALEATLATPGHGLETLQEAERRQIERVLRSEDRNVTRSAVVLGISRATLYQKIKKHRIAISKSRR
jgi:DNA-binding NtrC family response regulator